MQKKYDNWNRRGFDVHSKCNKRIESNSCICNKEKSVFGGANVSMDLSQVEFAFKLIKMKLFYVMMMCNR